MVNAEGRVLVKKTPQHAVLFGKPKLSWIGERGAVRVPTCEYLTLEIKISVWGGDQQSMSIGNAGGGGSSWSTSRNLVIGR